MTAPFLPTEFVCVSSTFFRWSAAPCDAAADAIYQYLRRTRTSPLHSTRSSALPYVAYPGKFFSPIF